MFKTLFDQDTRLDEETSGRETNVGWVTLRKKKKKHNQNRNIKRKK